MGRVRNLKLLEACEAWQHRLTQVQMQGSSSEVVRVYHLIHGWQCLAVCGLPECSVRDTSAHSQTSLPPLV